MKIIIYAEKIYPDYVYELAINNSEQHSIEVDDETIKRWEQIKFNYYLMQKEMRKLYFQK